MEKLNNTGAISRFIQEAKTALESERAGFEAALAAEVKRQEEKASRKLLEAMEDPEKLSPKQAKDKAKRDFWYVASGVGAGAAAGLVVLGVVLLVPALTAGLVASTALGATAAASLPFAIGGVGAAIATAIGYGAGVLRGQFTPYMPKLDVDVREEIATQAKQKIETEMVGKVACQLRLARTEGRLSHAELAEVAEALADMARLQFKIPEAAVQSLKDTAREARDVGLKEAEEKRAEAKLTMEKNKEEKVEKREDRKDDIAIRKMEQDIKLERMLARHQMKHPRSDGFEQLLTKISGNDGAILGTLADLALIKKMSGFGAGPKPLAA